MFFRIPPNRLSIILFIAFLLQAHTARSQGVLPDVDWFERSLGDGVVWKHYLFDDLFGSMQSVSYVEVDLTNPAIEISFPYQQSSRERISSLIPRVIPNAVAGINGTYFNTSGGGHVTYLRVDGNEIPPGGSLFSLWGYEGAIGLDGSGAPAIVEKPAGGWGEEAAHPDLMACGPLLINDDVIPVDHLNSIGGHCSNRHPRSAVGVTADNRLILLTVDGRTEMAAGMTCEELALVMQDLGCPDALNLDGGGSTTLWGAEEPFSGVLNFPSDNGTYDHQGERSCANGVAVSANAPTPVAWDGRIVSKSYDPLMENGSKQSVTIAYENIGTETWSASEISFITARPEGRTSDFHDPTTWVSPSEPATMQPTTVLSGATATFTFDLQAMEVTGTQVFSEHFMLVHEANGRIGPADSAAWMRLVVQADVQPGESFIVESRSGGQNFGWYSDEGMANTGANCSAQGATSGIGSRYGSTYRSIAGFKQATISPDFPLAGKYRVSAAWPSGSNRRNPITYHVNHAFGSDTFQIDQTATANEWIAIGNEPYWFSEGTGDTVLMTNEDIDISGSMYASAFRFEYIEPIPSDKSYTVNSIEGPADGPLIDGYASPGEWDTASAPATGFVHHDDPGVSASESASFQMLYDSSALYFLVQMENAFLRSFPSPSPPVEWADLAGDKINFYMTPFGPETAPFYRILLAPNPNQNTCHVWSQAATMRTTSPDEGTSWVPSGAAAMSYQEGLLTLEYRIPWAEFNASGMAIGSAPGPGDVWGIQLAITNEVSEGLWEYVNWEPDDTPTFVLGNPFGTLQFSNQLNRVSRWELF